MTATRRAASSLLANSIRGLLARQFSSSSSSAAAAAAGGATTRGGAAGPAATAPAKRLGLADVQHVIAVASGKGGVGKSTVAGGLCSHK